MKKTIMAAVCAATLLTAVTAFANEYDIDNATRQYHGSYGSYDNEYSIMHPYYMPEKGHGRVDAGYSNENLKFDNANVKFIYPGKRKTKEYFVEGMYALSDTWFVNLKYNVMKDDLKSTQECTDYLGWLNNECNSRFGEPFLYIDTFTNSEKVKSWHLGFTNKFMNDEKSFGKWSFTYYKNSSDDFHAFRPTSGDSIDYYWYHGYDFKESGIILEGMYGLKGESVNPYLKAKYITTLNHCSKYNDGWGTIGAGIYKQCTEKFGVNLEIDYTKTTNIVKENYLEGCLDARFALAENCALKIGYAFQLSDSQHSFKSEDYLYEWLDDKTNFKSKSRNRIFATLSFAF